MFAIGMSYRLYKPQLVYLHEQGGVFTVKITLQVVKKKLRNLKSLRYSD